MLVEENAGDLLELLGRQYAFGSQLNGRVFAFCRGRCIVDQGLCLILCAFPSVIFKIRRIVH